MGREIYDIINDMAEVLNASQMQKLQEVYNRLTESGVELRLREMGKKSGVEKVHPHKFGKYSDMSR